jgi:hypothetical protein
VCQICDRVFTGGERRHSKHQAEPLGDEPSAVKLVMKQPFKVINGAAMIRVGKKHHLAQSTGYAPRSRLVAEAAFGVTLTSDYYVAHKNGDKMDDRPENLSIEKGTSWAAKARGGFAKHRRFPDEPNPEIYCACGCGEKTTKYDNYGRQRRFLPHNNNNLAKKSGKSLRKRGLL